MREAYTFHENVTEHGNLLMPSDSLADGDKFTRSMKTVNNMSSLINTQMSSGTISLDYKDGLITTSIKTNPGDFTSTIIKPVKAKPRVRPVPQKGPRI
jgi:hypothetical protein